MSRNLYLLISLPISGLRPLPRARSGSPFDAVRITSPVQLLMAVSPPSRLRSCEPPLALSILSGTGIPLLSKVASCLALDAFSPKISVRGAYYFESLFHLDGGVLQGHFFSAQMVRIYLTFLSASTPLPDLAGSAPPTSFFQERPRPPQPHRFVSCLNPDYTFPFVGPTPPPSPSLADPRTNYLPFPLISPGFLALSGDASGRRDPLNQDFLMSFFLRLCEHPATLSRDY